jgi:hypothetical protein
MRSAVDTWYQVAAPAELHDDLGPVGRAARTLSRSDEIRVAVASSLGPRGLARGGEGDAAVTMNFEDWAVVR